MEIGVSSCERKPIATVTVGSVTISIYASPVTVRPEAKLTAADSSQPASVPDSKIYESFQIVHYEGNRRIFQRRNTLEKAKVLAEECGTSPKMIKKNYQSRAAISRETAEEWFRI